MKKYNFLNFLKKEHSKTVSLPEQLNQTRACQQEA